MARIFTIALADAVKLSFVATDIDTTDRGIKQHIHDVVLDFLRSPEGEMCRVYNNGNFSYLDLASQKIPMELFQKHGLIPLWYDQPVSMNANPYAQITTNVAAEADMMFAVKHHLQKMYKDDPDHYPYMIAEPSEHLIRRIARHCECTWDTDKIEEYALRILGPRLPTRKDG